jgi:hypothetical protein
MVRHRVAAMPCHRDTRGNLAILHRLKLRVKSADGGQKIPPDQRLLIVGSPDTSCSAKRESEME